LAIRFFVPVHLYGHAMNLKRVEALVQRYKLTLIEDCAQAIGAKSFGRTVGTLGRVCATSFYPTKNLGALGDAGALLTSDPELAKRARSLRDYGQSSKYVHAEIGLNSRLDELQAAMLKTVQLPSLPGQTERRRAIADRYVRELNNDLATPLPVPEGSQSVWHLFPLKCPQRDALKSHLARAGVASGVHYPSIVPDQPGMASVPYVVATPLEKARTLAREELSIPLHPWLSDDDVGAVIQAVNSFKGGV
jgi:dTDP-3-amino-3,4,6-trideoxy-alpha-D-glucose transaminase